jgi:thymidylate kinase
VRRGYLELAKQEPGRFRVVDASPPPEEIQKEIRRIVDQLLNAEAN